MTGQDPTVVCAHCGSENPAGARFCNHCGREIEDQAHGAEKRQITVVFTDLSGFTAMSERMDPEDVQTVMDEIFRTATEIIGRYSGRVDKLIGDAVMSVFGDPTSHEDDAERAIRATLEIHAAVEQLSSRYEEEIGRPLVMHSGVNTGMVVTSSGTFDTADTGPLGDTINLAARLEGLSQAGEVLLGPETARLVSDVFELADYGLHDLKGKSGKVDVMSVAGFKRTRMAPSRKRAGFVGRHEELGILMAAVERVKDGQSSVVGIRAEAGSGKTRLLEEFSNRVDETIQWLEGRAYAYGENIPYAPLVDLISNAIDIGEGDTPDSIATKLGEQIGPLVDHDDRILDPFVRLYGLPERKGAALDMDSFQDRLLESLKAVLEALCLRAPTVLVFQDLHWADPSTIGIVSALITTISTPTVIVVNYRPSFTEALPNMREIDLTPLSPRQSIEMLQSMLGGSEPPTSLAKFIIDRTDGNPFYVEEIVNSLIETRVLVTDGETWAIEGALEDADLPASIRGVIAARIDRLDNDRRRVLREASVVGRQFLYDVIKRVATSVETLDPSLADLEDADLIREHQQQADLEYFFKHALTQDVAYEGLLKHERAQLHGRVAAAIEAQFAGRLNEVTETLAYHYSESGITDKAAQYLRAAGRKAVDRYALVEAQSHYQRAYDLLTGGEAPSDQPELLVDLILDWAIVWYYEARLVDLDVIMERHQALVDGMADERRLMWWLIWRGHANGFKLDQGDNMRFLDEAMEIAARLGDDRGLVYAKTWSIWAYFITGQPERAIEAAAAIDDWVTENRDIDPYPYFKSKCTLSFVLSTSGRVEGVSELCEEVIAFGRQVGNNRCIAYGLQGLAMMHMVLGNHYRAIDLADQASRIAKDPIYRDTAQLTVVASASFLGDRAKAQQAIGHLRNALGGGIQLPAPLFVELGEAMARLTRGDLTAGIARLQEVSEQALAASRRWEWIWGRAYGVVALARIATGETKGDLVNLARNPGFIRYLRRSRKESRPALERLIADARDLGFDTHLLQIELAKVLLHEADAGAARPLLDDALAFAGQSPESEGPDRIRGIMRGL
jgi:class 3 adenylate cyclase